MQINKKTNIVIYQAPNGAIELKGDFDKKTIRASQAQMAEMFWVTSQNITLHIKNIYKDQELHEKATCKESLQVQTEGNRTIKRKIRVYNLDVLIAVWYRISSITGTRFRQWATKVLSEHITQWYTINKKILQKNYNTFMKSVEDTIRSRKKEMINRVNIGECITNSFLKRYLS